MSQGGERRKTDRKNHRPKCYLSFLDLRLPIFLFSDLLIPTNTNLIVTINATSPRIISTINIAIPWSPFRCRLRSLAVSDSMVRCLFRSFAAPLVLGFTVCFVRSVLFTETAAADPWDVQATVVLWLPRRDLLFCLGHLWAFRRPRPSQPPHLSSAPFRIHPPIRTHTRWGLFPALRLQDCWPLLLLGAPLRYRCHQRWCSTHRRGFCRCCSTPRPPRRAYRHRPRLHSIYRRPQPAATALVNLRQLQQQSGLHPRHHHRPRDSWVSREDLTYE